MTQMLEVGPSPQVPPEVADLIRAELPSLIGEVVAEIRRTIPEYGRPEESAYDQILRLGVTKVLNSFITRIVDPGAPLVDRDETCRALGHFEAVEGRSLDHIHAAFRIALHIAWRRTMTVAERENVPSSVVGTMVETMLVYVDEAIAQTQHGFQQAMDLTNLRHRQDRKELLQEILRQPAPSADSLKDLATRAAWWPLPEEATMIAVAPDAHCTLAALDSDVLIDIDSPERCLLVPGALDVGRMSMLKVALADASSVMGLTLPLTKAHHSLRWARRVLNLAADGIIRDGSLIPCENHLITMWLLSDTELIEELARRHLAPLADVSDSHRRKLTETLTEWVCTRGNAVEISERLQVHPQTVRYRLRQLDGYLSEVLDDPDERFSIDVTLRAARLYRRRHLGRRGTPGA